MLCFYFATFKLSFSYCLSICPTVQDDGLKFSYLLWLLYSIIAILFQRALLQAVKC